MLAIINSLNAQEQEDILEGVVFSGFGPTQAVELWEEIQELISDGSTLEYCIDYINNQKEKICSTAITTI